MTQHRHRMRTIIVGLVTALTILAATAGTANASDVSSSAHRFASQARSAGLTSVQADALQARVDEYLATSGGTQVSANKVEFANGATLLVTLPGERQARDIATASAAGGCPYLRLCAFRHEYWTGDEIFYRYCGPADMPWTGLGSWTNNQTPGTEGRFLNYDVKTIITTLPAYSQGYTVNWTPVFYVVPC